MDVILDGRKSHFEKKRPELPTSADTTARTIETALQRYRQLWFHDQLSWSAILETLRIERIPEMIFQAMLVKFGWSGYYALRFAVLDPKSPNRIGFVFSDGSGFLKVTVLPIDDRGMAPPRRPTETEIELVELEYNSSFRIDTTPMKRSGRLR